MVKSERGHINSSQFVMVEEKNLSSFNSPEDSYLDEVTALQQRSVSEEEFKSKVSFMEPPQRAAVDGGLSDVEDDETVLDEFEVPDDEQETNFTAAQQQIIQNKTLLSVNDKALNNAEFRQSYLKAKIPTRQLIKRRVEKRQLLKEHAETVKTDTKKNLVFKFVKQSYIS